MQWQPRTMCDGPGPFSFTCRLELRSSQCSLLIGMMELDKCHDIPNQTGSLALTWAGIILSWPETRPLSLRLRGNGPFVIESPTFLLRPLAEHYTVPGACL
jgi:hypothetical protein